MNTTELKALWSAAENDLPPEGARNFAVAAVADMNRERRWHRGLLAYVFVMVSLLTIHVVWQFSRHQIGWEEAWPATLMVAALWITAHYPPRNFRQGHVAPAEGPIRATLETLLHQAQTRCRELRTLLGLFVVMIPLAAIAIVQLQADGKMRPSEAASASLLFAVIVLSFGGWLLTETAPLVLGGRLETCTQRAAQRTQKRRDHEQIQQ